MEGVREGGREGEREGGKERGGREEGETPCLVVLQGVAEPLEGCGPVLRPDHQLGNHGVVVRRHQVPCSSIEQYAACVHVRTHTHTRKHTCMHACTHTRTHAHSHMHACTHT